MNYKYKASIKIINKIFSELSNRYEETYKYGSKYITKIEIPCYKFDIEYIKELFIKLNLTIFDFNKMDIILIERED